MEIFSNMRFMGDIFSERILNSVVLSICLQRTAGDTWQLPRPVPRL